MTDLQLFDSLCTIIEQQAAVIRELVTQLKELDAVTDETAEKLFMLERATKEATGDSKP